MKVSVIHLVHNSELTKTERTASCGGLSSGYPFIKWLPKAVRPLSNTAAKTLHNSQSNSFHGINISAVKQSEVEDNRKDQRGEYALQHSWLF